MSKTVKKFKTLQKVIHPPILKTIIPAGLAGPGAPLGLQLGQRGINIASFCKEFNAKTDHLIPGVPLPCRIHVNHDRTYKLEIQNPSTSFMIKQAAGITRGAMASETVGKITYKHVYEIARIKKTDYTSLLTPMKQLCEVIIGQAKLMGVQVVRDYDPEEYAVELEEYRAFAAQQRQELEELKQAKLLRK